MPPAGVVLLQAEDSVSNTVKPDLIALGADIDRALVYDPSNFQGKPLTLPDDIGLVEDAVAEVHAKLVVIDPAAAFFNCNANSDQSVRKALKPLAELAESEGIAVLLVRHPNKAGSKNPLYQASGSIAWIAAARSALRAVDDPNSDEPYRHLLVQVKTNLAAAPSMAYQTVMVDGHIQVEWLGTSNVTIKTLHQGDDGSKLRETMEILFLILRKGPDSAKDVRKRAKEEGVAGRTLDRAKAALGVKSERHQFSPYGWWHWQWRLPDEENEILAAIRQKYEALDAEAVTPSAPTEVAALTAR